MKTNKAVHHKIFPLSMDTSDEIRRKLKVPILVFTEMILLAQIVLFIEVSDERRRCCLNRYRIASCPTVQLLFKNYSMLSTRYRKRKRVEEEQSDVISYPVI